MATPDPKRAIQAVAYVLANGPIPCRVDNLGAAYFRSSAVFAA
jgi:hypothetical protein